IRDHNANSSADSTEKVESQKTPGSPRLFQFSAEHPEREHVEQNMPDAAVKKHVGDQLPYEQQLHHSFRVQGKVPKHLIDARSTREVPDDKNRDIQNQEPLDRARQAAPEIGIIARVGPGAVTHRQDLDSG